MLIYSAGVKQKDLGGDDSHLKIALKSLHNEKNIWITLCQRLIFHVLRDK